MGLLKTFLIAILLQIIISMGLKRLMKVSKLAERFFQNRVTLSVTKTTLTFVLFFGLAAVVGPSVLLFSDIGDSQNAKKEIQAQQEQGFLNADQAELLIQASNLGYKVRLVQKGVNGVERLVVFLGETHMKSDAESQIGSRIIAQFGVIGFEGIKEENGAWLNNFAFHIATSLRSLTEFLSRHSDKVKGSTVDEIATLDTVQPEEVSRLPKGVKTATIVHLEAGDIVSFEPEIKKLKVPFWDFVIGKRNVRMTANLIKTMKTMPDEKSFLVVVGAAHVDGMIQDLNLLN